MPGPYLTFEKEAYFPKLRRDQYYVTSYETVDYNCIAHAANDATNWWWPIDQDGVHWPAGVDREETVERFAEAYATVGYAVCGQQSRTLEEGFERIAIYADAEGIPTHAARQLPDGGWTSKLGEWEDIRHETLEAVEAAEGVGLGYGTVVLIMKRQRRAP